MYRFLIVLSFLFLAGCQSTPDEASGLHGQMLLWHGWDEAETEVLNQVLAQFQAIHPQTHIISIAVDPAELLNKYREATRPGLGPDLVIGSSEWIQELANLHFIRPLASDEIRQSYYLSTSTKAVRYQGELYGFPLALQPTALYYNTKQVTTPASTLDELFNQAKNGKRVAMVSKFEPAYWGIQTFGEGLFNNQDRFTLAQSGFTEWLKWLSKANSEPGIILNTDQTSLRELFIKGDVAYYVGSTSELPLIQAAMKEETFQVARLPLEPKGPSGPLLTVETVMLSSISSQNQAKLALAVAQYLTNEQQSRTFMRVLNKVPANQRVDVDPRVHSLVSGFSEQSRTAVALPNTLERPQFYALGDAAYTGVLSGLVTPADAVCQFGIAVMKLQNYSPEDVDLPPGCSPNQGAGE